MQSNFLTNLFFAVIGRPAHIRLDRNAYMPWLTLIALSSISLLLFSGKLWGVGLVQAASAAILILGCRPSNRYHLPRGIFVALFGPALIIPMILLDMPGILILPLFLYHSNSVGSALRLRQSDLENSGNIAGMPTITDEEAQALRRLRASRNPGSNLVESGPVIGTYQGCEFVDFFVDESGRKYQFAGTISDSHEQVLDSEGCFVVPPGLIYQVVPSPEKAG